jgi:hypothetical protein
MLLAAKVDFERSKELIPQGERRSAFVGLKTDLQHKYRSFDVESEWGVR